MTYQYEITLPSISRTGRFLFVAPFHLEVSKFRTQFLLLGNVWELWRESWKKCWRRRADLNLHPTRWGFRILSPTPCAQSPCCTTPCRNQHSAPWQCPQRSHPGPFMHSVYRTCIWELYDPNAKNCNWRTDTPFAGRISSSNFLLELHRLSCQLQQRCMIFRLQNPDLSTPAVVAKARPLSESSATPIPQDINWKMRPLRAAFLKKSQVSWPGWRPFRGISSPGKQSLRCRWKHGETPWKHDETWYKKCSRSQHVFWWLPKWCCLSFPRHECWVLPSSSLILVSQNDLQKDPWSSGFLSRRNGIETLDSQEQRQVACSASPRRSIDSGFWLPEIRRIPRYNC